MTFSAFLPFAGASCSVALAIGVALRARRSKADWVFAVGLLILAADSTLAGLSARAAVYGEIVQWQKWKILTMSFLPGVWLLFSLSYARGNAREFLARWRAPLAVAFLLPITLYVVFRQHLVGSLDTTSTGLMLRLERPGAVLHFLFLVSSVLILMNLERTFRASVGTMRWRLKFMLLGVGLLFIARAYTSSQALLFRSIDPALESVESAALLVAVLLVVGSLLRARNFVLDVYPSQSVLQGSLTVLLAGIYLLVVGLLAKVVTYLGGDATFALKAFLVLLALVVLAILLQSERIRLHVRRFVSRNFQRPLYDYRTVWRKFNEGTASHIEQNDLCRSLVKLTAEMFQALSVGIWLLDDQNETVTLVASTFTPGTHAREFALPKLETSAALRHFKAHPEPVDFEQEKTTWAEVLRQSHPAQFLNGGDRVCIPIVARGDVIGLITLGDRVAGAAFSLQDFDMLKCVGDHAAASLLNVRLSQRLLQAKELEAFQTMAAFFVHDMKNAASTLNLMLQNLPVHFNDPAFREDALRGVSKTVTHMNHLIGRLSMLRRELKIQPTPADLNQVVNAAVAGLEAGPNFTLAKDLPAIPVFPFDRDQISKVVTNLVLNAREALSGSGEIRVTTRLQGAWAVLGVTDNGCGMSAEYLQRSLFRPFQTTKKSGLGIGMFQSKMIVEAHGGRITVVSEPGKGSTFEVFLPTTGPIR